ncbi:helix-turn-helix domain-containing protein [Corynebacterium pseudokroppenstedtii]|uniref:helix-turn-helix domain-containing protein n=1 Tax=Corynebacterium pseudokroppenstedtii TaxID=2804917 RepID=UPI003078E38C
MKKFQRWVEQITNHGSVREISRHVDVSPATVARQIKQGTPQLAFDLARAYDVNPLPGLIALGHVTYEHINELAAHLSIEGYSELELAQEIVRRLETKQDNNESNLETTDPIPHRHLYVAPDFYDDDTTPDEEDLPYVADSSPTEPEPGDDDYSDGP